VSNAASEAAAGLAPELAAELLGKLAPSELAAASTLVQEVADAAGQNLTTPSSPEAVSAPAVTEAQETEEFHLPEFQLVELEDDEDEDLLVVDEDDDEQLVDEYEDESVLRARLARLEKQNKHLAKEAAGAKLDAWKKKYKAMYPLANLDAIDATSRRAFEKAAVKSHNANFTLLEPIIKQFNDAREQLVGAATAEGRAAAAAAFGKPTAGPGIVPLQVSAQTEGLVAARKTGDLRKVIGELFKQG
jgi:hypothetical protein